MAKAEGKDTHFNVSTRTVLKKFAVSKKEVLIKESDLPAGTIIPARCEGQWQGSPAGTAVADEPTAVPFWQRTIRWLYGNKILVLGVHVDGEVGEERQQGKVNLSGALCSPYTPEPGQAVEDVVGAAVEIADQIADDWASVAEKPVLQIVAADGASSPQDAASVVQPAPLNQEELWHPCKMRYLKTQTCL